MTGFMAKLQHQFPIVQLKASQNEVSLFLTKVSLDWCLLIGLVPCLTTAYAYTAERGMDYKW